MDLDLLFNCDEDQFSQFGMYYLLSDTRPDPQFKFDLEKITDADCKLLFRFEKVDLYRLCIAMGVPDTLQCEGNRIRFSGIEGICIFLRRLAYPNRLFDLTKVFPRSKPELSSICKRMLNFIFDKYQHLLQDVNQWWMEPRFLTTYSNAVQAKGAPLHNCWGFIDGTVRPTCRPGKDQREFFNGHKRCHGIKFQSVVSPNGMIANLYGPVVGRRHDSYLLAASKLLEKLEAKFPAGGPVYTLYGDPAYPIRAQLLGPFKHANLNQQEAQFNKRMSSVRETVEWEFGRMVHEG